MDCHKKKNGNRLTLSGSFFRAIFLAEILFLSCLALSCRAKNPVSQTCNALGTVCSVRIPEGASMVVYEQLFSRLEQIENEMSSSLPESEISILNNAILTSEDGKIDDFLVSEDVFCVLQCALEIAELTDGAFDPTIGSLVKLWDINNRVNLNEQKPLPSEQEIFFATKSTDYRVLKLNSEKHSVSIDSSSSVSYRPQIELGGIAKGFAADELVKILKENEINHAIIDLGGNIYAFGAKSVNPENDEVELPWRIGIKNPKIFGEELNGELNEELNSQVIAILECVDKSVVTSGGYERYFEKDGKIYHHILDCKTGYPAESDLISTTIICPSSMLADSLSTSCFVLGSEKAKKIMTNFSSVNYVFVKNDWEVITNCTDELTLFGAKAEK